MDILDCPFCGCAGKLTFKHFKKNYMGMRSDINGYMHMDARTIWFATCSNESCMVKPTTRYQDEKVDAVNIWNSRAAGKIKVSNTTLSDEKQN